jgi:hypothetical protein
MNMKRRVFGSHTALVAYCRIDLPTVLGSRRLPLPKPDVLSTAQVPGCRLAASEAMEDPLGAGAGAGAGDGVGVGAGTGAPLPVAVSACASEPPPQAEMAAILAIRKATRRTRGLVMWFLLLCRFAHGENVAN